MSAFWTEKQPSKHKQEKWTESLQNFSLQKQWISLTRPFRMIKKKIVKIKLSFRYFRCQKPTWRLSTGTCCDITHSERVGLFPGDGRSPRRRPHLLRQGLRHGHQDEADVQEGDGCGQDHHQRVAVGLGQVGSDGGAGDQAGCEGSRYLRGGRGTGGKVKWRTLQVLLERVDYTSQLDGFKQFSFVPKGPYQTVRRTPLMLLGDVSHVGEYHRKGDGKDTRHRDDGKVPPEGKTRLLALHREGQK